MLTKAKIIFSVLVLLAVPVLGYADEDFNPSSYLFFLYYDRGELFANRDFVTPYDVVTAEYKEAVGGENDFRGELSSAKGTLLATFKFDPQGGDKNLKKGAIVVSAPYFFNAHRADFYSNLGDKLVTISVAEQSFCNENRVCDDKENKETCPADCAAFTPALSSLPSFSFPPSLGEWTMYFQGTMGITILSVGVVLAILILSVRLVRRWLRKKKNDLPPPQI